MCGGNAFEISRKRVKKLTVVTENKPGLDEPPTTTTRQDSRRKRTQQAEFLSGVPTVAHRHWNSRKAEWE